MRAAMTEDQVRRAGANAIALGTFPYGGDQPGIAGKPQIIVAAERHKFAPIDPDTRIQWRFQNMAMAFEPARVQRRKFVSKIG